MQVAKSENYAKTRGVIRLVQNIIASISLMYDFQKDHRHLNK